MTVQEFLKQSITKLEKARVGTARLDCLVLLEDVLGKDRSHLLAHPEVELLENQLKTLHKQIEKRQSHIPLAQIRGKTEFYGRNFKVTTDTLEPRSETETIIDLLKTIVTPKQVSPVVIDIGTGSGCLGITAKLELPNSTVYAVDISEKCLEVARQNAKRLKADVKFFCGNLLSAIPPNTYQIPPTILANLPYVPDNHTINRAAMHEPRLAIFGGKDGLDLYRELFMQIEDMDNKMASTINSSGRAKLVLTESLPFQHEQLAQIAQSAGYSLKMSDDFIQIFELTEFTQSSSTPIQTISG